MSFGDHLEELRKRMLLALAAPLPLFVVVFLFADTLIEWLLLPVYEVLRQHGLPQSLQVLSPPEFLVTELKLSIIGALVLSAPWILWQAWLFVAPGLYQRERRFVYFLLPGSTLLTAAGVALLYFVMLPLMLHVLVMFAAGVRIDTATALDPRAAAVIEGSAAVPVRASPPREPVAGDLWLEWPSMKLFAAVAAAGGAVEVLEVPPAAGGRIDQSFRVSFVVNFTLVLLLGIVVAFQMPLVIVLLGWLDLVRVPWLRRQRKYAVLVCGVVAAVITPADAASMIMMLVPLYALYELGIVLLALAPASRVAEGSAFRFGRGRQRAQSAADNRSSDGASERPVEVVQSEASQPRSSGRPGPRPESPPGPADTDEPG